MELFERWQYVLGPEPCEELLVAEPLTVRERGGHVWS
jgi:hypothetical protein